MKRSDFLKVLGAIVVAPSALILESRKGNTKLSFDDYQPEGGGFCFEIDRNRCNGCEICVSISDCFEVHDGVAEFIACDDCTVQGSLHQCLFAPFGAHELLMEAQEACPETAISSTFSGCYCS